MAYKDFDAFSMDAGTDIGHSQTFQADSGAIDLPDSSYVRDADLQRDGGDLVLDGPQGTITVEGYFDAAEAPTLNAPDGSSLTPDLVNSFAKSPSQYASNLSMSDESPVGAVNEISGDATVTRTDGSVEPVSLGTEIYQGDIVETASDGAVNIVFSDESSFAVSEDARLAIDEYVFDPSTEEGAQNFSVLKGVFVFTSGLVGRDDPDDVHIETPSGSIGIRGTIIAGDVDNGEITVVEGAIVLRDHDGNEMTLANQYETAKFEAGGKGISNQGQLSANDVNQKFASVSKVSPTLFSSVNDTAAEAASEAVESVTTDEAVEGDAPAGEEAAPDADGTVDADGDNQVDGSVEEAGEAPVEGGEAMDGPADVMGEAPEAMPEAKPAMKMMAQEMMGDAMDSGMSRGEANEATMEGMMEKAAEMQEMREQMKEAMEEAQEAAEDAASGDGEVGGEESAGEGIDTTNIDPNLLVEDMVEQEIPVIDFSGNSFATQGGTIYHGDITADVFTNQEGGAGGQVHQNIAIKTGGGDDVITLVSETSDLSDLKIKLVDGGAGDNDVLNITANNIINQPLDLSNIEKIKGIETLNLNDGNAQTLHFDDIFDVRSSEGFSSTNGGTPLTSMKTVEINADGGDTINLDGTVWTKQSNTGEELSGDMRYEGTVDGEQVRLLIDDGVVNLI